MWALISTKGRTSRSLKWTVNSVGFDFNQRPHMKVQLIFLRVQLDLHIRPLVEIILNQEAPQFSTGRLYAAPPTKDLRELNNTPSSLSLPGMCVLVSHQLCHLTSNTAPNVGVSRATSLHTVMLILLLFCCN